MKEEDLMECIVDIDEILSEAENYLEEKNYKKAYEKIREARDAVEEVREDEDASDDPTIESTVINKLK